MADADPYVCQDSLPHYWLIDRPSGPTSKGACSRCHVERDFLNSSMSAAEWRRSGVTSRASYLAATRKRKQERAA